MSPKVRELVLFRAGDKCERCGRSLVGILYSIHHRCPRGMGGSKLPWLHLPSNLLALCGSGTTGCHGWIESNREASYAFGLLLTRDQNPSEVAVRLLHGYVFLTDDGEYKNAEWGVSPMGTALIIAPKPYGG